MCHVILTVTNTGTFINVGRIKITITWIEGNKNGVITKQCSTFKNNHNLMTGYKSITCLKKYDLP